jgi:hypothetical protein
MKMVQVPTGQDRGQEQKIAKRKFEAAKLGGG